MATTSGPFRVTVVAFADRLFTERFVSYSNDNPNNVFPRFPATANVTALSNANYPRSIFREGSDLWLVYNDAVNTQRQMIGRPQLPFSDQRALMLKYTYTFIR